MSLPDLFLPKINYFGLSIEKTAIRAVELDNKDKPKKYAEVKLPEDTFKNGMLVKKENFIKSLKNLLTAGKFSTHYAAITFPESLAYTRGHTLPLIEINEITEAISWRTKELFPFPKEEIYYDWKLINRNENDQNISVVAVQRKVLDSLVESFISAGINPLRFEPDTSALSRLLSLNEDQSALLIEVNPRDSYVTLVTGGKAIFTTVISNNQKESADSYIKSIDTTLLEVASFYQKKEVLKKEKTQIVIAGEMASEQWIAHIKQLLAYPVAIIKAPIPNSAFNKAYVAAKFKISPPTDEHSINVLPLDLQKKYDDKRNQQFYKSLFVRAIAIIVVLISISLVSYIILSIEKNRISGQVKEAQSFMQSQTGANAGVLQLNALAKNIIALSPLRKTSKEQIERINKLKSNEIVFTQINYDSGNLAFSVHGIAKTREALLLLKDNIEKDDNFTKVTLPLGSLETPIDVSFIITFISKQ